MPGEENPAPLVPQQAP